MSNGAKQDPPSLDEFAKRLDAARNADEAGADSRRAGGVALGRAFRAGSELLAALLVGALLGVGLDQWLDTKPFALLVGILFGFAAGVRNVGRAFKESAEASASAATESRGPSGGS